MNTPALIPDSPDAADSDVEAMANMLRAALQGAPEAKRAAIAARLCELIAPPKTPKRPGAVLDNVIDLFKREQREEWTAADVLERLRKGGKPIEPKKVYGALTYLQGMKILRRVGYGRYLVEGGALLVSHDREVS